MSAKKDTKNNIGSQSKIGFGVFANRLLISAAF